MWDPMARMRLMDGLQSVRIAKQTLLVRIPWCKGKCPRERATGGWGATTFGVELWHWMHTLTSWTIAWFRAWNRGFMVSDLSPRVVAINKGSGSRYLSQSHSVSNYKWIQLQSIKDIISETVAPGSNSRSSRAWKRVHNTGAIRGVIVSRINWTLPPDWHGHNTIW